MFEKLPDVLGHALREQRAGFDALAFHQSGLRSGQGALQVTSLAFRDHAPIPQRYTADGEGHSPPLQWSGVPAGAQQLVLLVEDADSPTPRPLVHAIVCGIAGADGAAAEGTLSEPPDDASGPDALRLGRSSALLARWLPPDPPPGHGSHRYAFQLFALAPGAELGETPGRDAVLEAVQSHGLASGMLVGTYERADTSVRDDDAVPAGLRPALG